MPKVHKVLQGEHISGIAERHGFLSWKTVWEDAGNTALRAKRNNPHVLQPGDEVFIPDKLERLEPASTTQVHVFAISAGLLFLRLKVLDIDSTAIKTAPYKAGIRANEAERVGVTDASGFLKEEIARPVDGVIDAEVRVTTVPKNAAPKTHKFDLKIGLLNPLHKLSGQQARLNNLGYYAGFEVTEVNQFRWAVEEFQEDHVLKGAKPVEKTPVVVAETEDPDEPTGITDDSKFLAKLQEVHGS